LVEKATDWANATEGNKVMLEVCVDTIQGAQIAADAGAQRIELCEALEVGGVTPSAKLVREIRSCIPLPLVVLIRCRPGDFNYDARERTAMLWQCETAVEMGADAIAVGGLVNNNALDIGFLREVAQTFQSTELVIHRAFDHVASQDGVLDELVGMGFDRVLTSGGPATAMEGCDHIAMLNRTAEARIQILPAGGVGPKNAGELLVRTGCRQLHGSFRFRDSGDGTKLLPNDSWIRRTRQVIDAILVPDRSLDADHGK
jgi:copper homeostasis protein